MEPRFLCNQTSFKKSMVKYLHRRSEEQRGLLTVKHGAESTGEDRLVQTVVII